MMDGSESRDLSLESGVASPQVAAWTWWWWECWPRRSELKYVQYLSLSLTLTLTFPLSLSLYCWSGHIFIAIRIDGIESPPLMANGQRATGQRAAITSTLCHRASIGLNLNTPSDLRPPSTPVVRLPPPLQRSRTSVPFSRLLA